MDGELTEKEFDLVSRSGKTIREGIKFIGGDPAKLATFDAAKVKSRRISSCTSNRAAFSIARRSISA